jgi:2-hydroxychromene-2-carboxylate isomerase
VAAAPLFYFDFSSPYAYLAAARVDDVLPVRPEWRPIAFGVIVRQLGKVPWSFKSDRTRDFEAIERRASERGLPPIRYPEGWPAETYSLTPLRAALLAADQDQLRAFTTELFRTAFVDGQHLADLDAVLDAAERAAGITSAEIKERLRTDTQSALDKGVTGVPTVAIGEQLFWGDDRLEDAARAVTVSPGRPRP